MSQEPPRQLGVTNPISTLPPTESELKLTEDLLQTLKDFGLFESEQEAQKRFVIKKTKKKESAFNASLTLE